MIWYGYNSLLMIPSFRECPYSVILRLWWWQWYRSENQFVTTVLVYLHMHCEMFLYVFILCSKCSKNCCHLRHWYGKSGGNLVFQLCLCRWAFDVHSWVVNVYSLIVRKMQRKPSASWTIAGSMDVPFTRNFLPSLTFARLAVGSMRWGKSSA